MGKLPVLFLTFNKIDPTEKVFEAIARYQPEVLYVAQDGPREGKEGDGKKVEKVRQLTQIITWPCKVVERRQEKNLGLKAHVEGAISWFFNEVEAGIILEDDTLPNADFFTFCEDLIERYRDDKRVFMVGGTNLNMPTPTPYSYFFCSEPLIWGWASWADRWKHYETDLQSTQETIRDFSNKSIFADPYRREVEEQKIGALLDNKVQSWASRWGYAIQVQHGLCAVPKVNTVTNIGFGGEASNTLDAAHPHAQLKLETFSWPMYHPSYMARCRVWEEAFFYPGQQAFRFHSFKELVLMLTLKIRHLFIKK